MGLSESETAGGGCKEHPYHNQKHGVCPSCLREKLSKLYVVPLNDKAAVAATTLSYSSSMSCSSASSSNQMSPDHHTHKRHHQRNASAIMSFRVSIAGGDGLKKSKSVAFVGADGKNGKKNKKKKGFWSKLLHLKAKKEANFDGKVPYNI